MKQMWLWVVVVLILLIGSGVFLTRSTGPEGEQEILPELEFEEAEEDDDEIEPIPGQFVQEVPESVEPAGEVTIEITESGFVPTTVTVAAGATVTFINNGQAPHWPASDVHPTHEILPEFDANRGLATGESYSHTFEEVGTWGCHDHLVPRNTCTIVVE